MTAKRSLVIKQIVTAAPTDTIATTSTRPYLFGLDYQGRVYIWDWMAKAWAPLDQIDDWRG